MTPDDRQKLEKFAWEQLEATADDEERWSFAWAREGCVGDISYCPWWLTEELEFDGDLRDLDLPWSKERFESIEADPNEEELLQWRRAMARKLGAKG
jgi:hypothetical protein